MGRGPLATGGTPYYADLVLEAVRAGGLDPAQLRSGLDFGGSSGRVVRVLGAVLPGVRWHACDPNGEAIAWAQRHLPAIDFRVSPQEPPLPYDDGAFDLVYAISIWSHFAAGAAGRWLDEMHRIVRPGGLLVITVQGLNSLAHMWRHEQWTQEDLVAAFDDLYRHGFHYRTVFSETEGDFGVKSPEWGMSVLTAEWLLERATPAWGLQWWATGRAEANQDVVVLVRR